jgi:signal transduction histidine kinase
MAGAVLLALALFAVLMVGAGRKFAVSKAEGVHFSGIDKPFLDISLAFVVLWCFIWLFVSVISISEIMRQPIIVNILMAVLSIAVITPVLFWFISFAKRVKAGKFWKHTLIYCIPRKLVTLFKPIWHGFKLMPKVAVISAAAFFAIFFVGIVGDVTRSGGVVFIFSVILAAAIAFLLTRYARRLYNLEQAAQKTSDGKYDENIDVGGGELGSIANSINNISAGINAAVEQRMKSERLRTELITNVSHDIRTPLTSIISYTDLLKKEGLDSEKAPEYLDILIQKSQRLKTLTDELFEAAKASTGNIDVNITELDVVSLINQVLGERDSTIKSSGLDLRLNLPESMHVKADGRLMWRVLENLLSNVFKYSLPNSRVYIDVFEENMLVRLDMKNISNAELNIDPAELIDRFKRGDDSRTDEGSGLGLSIVQSFVIAQGGKFEISIDGDLFKASVFLPLVKN